MNDGNQIPSGEIGFKYVFGEKDEVVIVLLYGSIGSREVSQLEKLEDELKSKTPPLVVFNFRDLSAFHPAGFSVFARIQKTIRDSKKTLGLCGLKPDVKRMLSSAGIIRELEVYNNVPEAWIAIRSIRHAA